MGTVEFVNVLSTAFSVLEWEAIEVGSAGMLCCVSRLPRCDKWNSFDVGRNLSLLFVGLSHVGL